MLECGHLGRSQLPVLLEPWARVIASVAIRMLNNFAQVYCTYDVIIVGSTSITNQCSTNVQHSMSNMSIRSFQLLIFIKGLSIQCALHIWSLQLSHRIFKQILWWWSKEDSASSIFRRLVNGFSYSTVSPISVYKIFIVSLECSLVDL